MTLTKQRPATDPIDQLMPAPRPWWLRLIAALAVLGAVGFLAWLWAVGYLRPAPDCCGSGSASAHLTPTADGGAVMISAYFFNSSPADVVVTGGSADVPRAQLLGVAPLTEDGDMRSPFRTTQFPVTVPGHGHLRLAVTFRPTECPPETPQVPEGGNSSGLGTVMNTPPEDRRPWGRLTLDLETPDRWLPTVGRSFELDDYLASGQPNELIVITPARRFTPAENPALHAACTLLGR